MRLFGGLGWVETSFRRFRIFSKRIWFNPSFNPSPFHWGGQNKKSTFFGGHYFGLLKCKAGAPQQGRHESNSPFSDGPTPHRGIRSVGHWVFASLMAISGFGCGPNVNREREESVKPAPSTEAWFGDGVGGEADAETGVGRSWKWDGGKVVERADVQRGELVEMLDWVDVENWEVEVPLERFGANLSAGYSKGPISPFGLTNDRFNFHMFWDADVWVFPALALVKPEVARRVPEMRWDQRAGAKENFRAWQAAGYPVVKGEKHAPIDELVTLARGVQPMMFPWETDMTGLERSPNPETRHQMHVTGGVALMLHRAIQLGLVEKAKGEEVIRGCAAFYLWRMDKNEDGSYGLRGVVSPSEWHTVANDLYTNAIADWTIRRAFGEKVWPRGKVRLPRRGDTFATFDGDDFDEYQQAAALLAVFPLQHPDIEPEARAMYRLYRGRHSEFGPAMSSAIDAVVAARLGLAREAGEDWDASWKPYTENPAVEFREKPRTGESYFLTGAAGAVNAAVYGIFGVRIQDEKPGDDEVAISLRNGGWLTVEPCLPEDWKYVSARLTVLGRGLEISGSGDEFSVTYDGKKLR
ncbi:hypothetical protein C0431_14285 [bacterium]|nr:hypothetical protein [bacterium]